MFQRLSNSWQLVKASADVLRADKELLVFPIVSSIVAMLVTASFWVPAYATGMSEQVFGPNEQRGALAYVFLFAFYFVQYLVVFYFNSALVGAALIRLQGGNPTAADGFRIANSNVSNLMGYAAIAATVGVALRFAADRGGRGGQWVSRIGGTAWTMASYLVVPVLVSEGLGPMAAVKRSTQLLRRTWGEQVIGGVGMGLVFFLVLLPLIALGTVAIVAVAGTGSPVLIAAVVLVFVLALIALVLVQSALGGIYTAALYRHAEGGDVSAFYPRQLVAQAFRSKPVR